MEIKFSVEQMEMQPTLLCNLDCAYCYLSSRDKNRRMAPSIAKRVAQWIAEMDSAIEIIWHGGEPLICGLNYFLQLISPFEKLREQGIVHHGIQTNATLINKRWCEFFHSYQFRVGVSLDGPLWANTQRVKRNGEPAFDKTMRGINHLRKANIPFSVICVIGKNSLNKARELYEFFSKIGCMSLGINIEETLGVHVVNSRNDDDVILTFWQELFSCWQKNPVIKMRDFARVMSSLALLGSEVQNKPPALYDIFPSVAWNGDVTLLSPEFLNTSASCYGNFVVGNVLDKNIKSIIKQGENASYVQDFLRGVSRCREECEYFPLCYGGQAGNKFFEYGTTDTTETTFCRNSEKRLVDAILQQLEQSEI